MAFTKVVGAGIHTLSNITSHNVHSSGIITATRFDGPFTNLNITGVATFAGDVSIGGTLTYEDVTNIDSVGIVTARLGIQIPNDTYKLRAGTDLEMQVFHNGTNSIIKDTRDNGKVRIQADNFDIRDKDDSKTLIAAGADSSVTLSHSGNTKIQTTNTGAVVTGILTATHFSGSSEVGIQSGGVQIGAGVTQLNFIGLGNTFAVNGTTVDVSISGNSGAGGTWSSYTAGIATTKSVGINTNNLDDNDLVGVGNSFQGLYISNGMMITDNKLSGNHYIGTAFNGLMAGPVTIEGSLTIDGNYVVV